MFSSKTLPPVKFNEPPLSAKDRVRTCVGLRRGFYRPEYLTTLPPWHTCILNQRAVAGGRTQYLNITNIVLYQVSYDGNNLYFTLRNPISQANPPSYLSSLLLYPIIDI